MKTTFLHISDIHYRADWPEEVQLVCQKFFEDIANQCKNYENLFLVISGDLLFSADDSSATAEFLDFFCQSLDRLGISRDCRICVPGNHDASQSELKPFLSIQTGCLSVMKDERSFNNNIKQLSESIFDRKFSKYLKYESGFAKYDCCAAGLGGRGWTINNEVGVYCLNTALCTYAALEDEKGAKISDRDRLMIDTRSLHKWMAGATNQKRVLVLHHPIDWLNEWSRTEIEKAIADKFHLVLSGHIHGPSATLCSHGAGGSVYCTAPPLFTKKSERLGYSFVTIDGDDGSVEVTYREWSPPAHRFVLGSALSGTDSGKLFFRVVSPGEPLPEVLSPSVLKSDPLSILEAEFEEAVTCYSTKKQIWVDRDLSSLPETAGNGQTAVLSSLNSLSTKAESCLIRAPKQYGLTCAGRFLALEHYRQSGGKSVILMMESHAIPSHRRGVIDAINSRCSQLRVDPQLVSGVILDNWPNDGKSKKLLREIRTEFPSYRIIILHGCDDCADITNTLDIDPVEFPTSYLCSLSRLKIRELVRRYLNDMSTLDEDAVTERVVSDIDALNIHRTPANCLLLLKLAEQAFDDTPVNRTDVIGRVLYLLFFQFSEIPTYAARPDLKDCEYALGYFCEWLIRSSQATFTKDDFFEKTREYCRLHLIDIDREVLFAFLVSERILARKGYDYCFRFSYWLHFFAAHRMHHSPEFAAYILTNRKYSAFPELIEFYTGIDRRRSDAIAQLTVDLKEMNDQFLERTGISNGFNPYHDAKWNPDKKYLELMEKTVSDNVAESSLPATVKDAIADRSYDRSKPYRQEIEQYILQSTLLEMVQAMRASARALRNSDHVDPNQKKELLHQVVESWIRVSQILLLLSPILAKTRAALFEGILFYLGDGFPEKPEEVLPALMASVCENVVAWYQDDISSKRMGALINSYANDCSGDFGELFVMLMLARQRPPRWEEMVEAFIVRTHKNSYYMYMLLNCLKQQYRLGNTDERNRQQLRRLTAMCVAKHSTGSKHPNLKLVEKTAKEIDYSALVPQRKVLPT